MTQYTNIFHFKIVHVVIAILIVFVVKNLTGSNVKKSKVQNILQAFSNKTDSPSSITIGMTLIKGGNFQMGSHSGDNNEKPVHNVILDQYYIGTHEVTFNEYDTYCRTTGKKLPKDEGRGRGELPVINVSWFDAITYCNWLSKKAKLKEVYTINGEEVSADFDVKGYRLPTEAEWEYAACSHSKNERWAGTNAQTNLSKYCNYNNDSGSSDSFQHTAIVGSLLPNNLGLYDMSGNVGEWCWDWRNDYSSFPQINPKGPLSANIQILYGQSRVLRGGSWVHSSQECRVTSRFWAPPAGRYNNSGFRLALSSSD